MADPVLAVHAGAGEGSPDPAARERSRQGLLAALSRGRTVLEAGGAALDAVQAAVAFMEDEVELFNAGRGAVLCADGTAELSAAVMRGGDRAAGAVAVARRSRSPVAAARAVMEHGDHVLLVGAAADAFAAARGVAQVEPEYFVTERQQARLSERGSDFAREAVGAVGTVGAVARDAGGQLAAATSTGGRRGQLPGRIGDSPVIGAGTWADERVAVSCTGDGEAFVRAAAAHSVGVRVAGGESLEAATTAVLGDVGALHGRGGVIAVAADGTAALPFTSPAMNRGCWRAGADPEAWV